MLDHTRLAPARIGMFIAVLTIAPTLSAQVPVVATTNTRVRIAAANLTSGNNQRYEAPGLRILKGLRPDIAAIQEFNYSSTNGLGINTPGAIREMIDATFGTNFVYFRESGAGYTIPNGVISRYPFRASGSWIDSDPGVNDRGFAWAQIDLPGTNDLLVVSVHLKASSGPDNVSRRAAEAAEIIGLINSHFPTNPWVIVAGDMNIHDETEEALTNFGALLSDRPVPTDRNGDPDTNQGRGERYDRVLASFPLTNSLVPVVLPSNTFSNGLVFVSTNYAPLSDVPPVQHDDSLASGMQHMAVIKDFQINYAVTNLVVIPPPVLTWSLPGIIRWQGLSNLVYRVQTKTNLANANWAVAGSASSTTTNISFTNQPDAAPQKFFRVVYP